MITQVDIAIDGSYTRPVSTEQEKGSVPLAAIHINLKDRSITFETEDQTATKLTLSPQGILYQLISPSPITERSVDKLLPDTEAKPEKENTITVTGRLKSRPTEGRPDAKGKPTAWAKLAVHEEGRADARLYSATFHRHTTKIALSLPADAQVTVQGYAHLAKGSSEKRMDTLSVINIVSYPGKSAATSS